MIAVPLMSPPNSAARVDVGKDNVDRYKAAGWTEVKSKKAESEKPAPKSSK